MEYYYEKPTPQHVTFEGRNMNFPPHVHQEVEIVTVISGSITLTKNGSVHPMQVGDSALIEPGSIHSYQSDGCSCLFTMFDSSVVPSMEKEIHSTVYPQPVWRSVSEEYMHAVTMLKEQHPIHGQQMLIKGYLYVILSLLTEHLQTGKEAGQASDNFQDILRYVCQHFTEEIPIVDTARRFGMTYEHLSRLYKAKTGMTYSMHVRQLRIAKAKQLLRETSRTILDIAIECGYISDRTFYRAFQSTVGLSPTAYRQQHG